MSSLSTDLGRRLAARIDGRVKENELLASHVYYRVGGPADLFVEPSNEEDIRIAIEFARAEGLPLTVIGAGTNLLVRDGGLEGLCLYLGAGLRGEIEILQENDDFVRVRVPSHWAKSRLLDESLRRGWGGLEFSAGIPGTVGGAVYMNAGTKWGSYGEVIESVRLFSSDLGFYEKSNAEMGFRYRGHGESVLRPWTVVVSADFKLPKRLTTQIAALADEILTYRGSKQPLELPNCGSVFKNPPSGPGAGRLVEACGLKGLCVGGAQVSLKHANFILNARHATATDLETLIEKVAAAVKEQKGVELEREVIILGRRQRSDSP